MSDSKVHSHILFGGANPKVMQVTKKLQPKGECHVFQEKMSIKASLSGLKTKELEEIVMGVMYGEDVDVGDISAIISDGTNLLGVPKYSYKTTTNLPLLASFSEESVGKFLKGLNKAQLTNLCLFMHVGTTVKKVEGTFKTKGYRDAKLTELIEGLMVKIYKQSSGSSSSTGIMSLPASQRVSDYEQNFADRIAWGKQPETGKIARQMMASKLFPGFDELYKQWKDNGNSFQGLESCNDLFLSDSEDEVATMTFEDWWAVPGNKEKVKDIVGAERVKRSQAVDVFEQWQSFGGKFPKVPYVMEQSTDPVVQAREDKFYSGNQFIYDDDIIKIPEKRGVTLQEVFISTGLAQRLSDDHKELCGFTDKRGIDLQDDVMIETLLIPFGDIYVVTEDMDKDEDEEQVHIAETASCVLEKSYNEMSMPPSKGSKQFDFEVYAKVGNLDGNMKHHFICHFSAFVKQDVSVSTMLQNVIRNRIQNAYDRIEINKDDFDFLFCDYGWKVQSYLTGNADIAEVTVSGDSSEIMGETGIFNELYKSNRVVVLIVKRESLVKVLLQLDRADHNIWTIFFHLIRSQDQEVMNNKQCLTMMMDRIKVVNHNGSNAVSFYKILNQPFGRPNQAIMEFCQDFNMVHVKFAELENRADVKQFNYVDSDYESEEDENPEVSDHETDSDIDPTMAAGIILSIQEHEHKQSIGPDISAKEDQISLFMESLPDFEKQLKRDEKKFEVLLERVRDEKREQLEEEKRLLLSKKVTVNFSIRGKASKLNFKNTPLTTTVYEIKEKIAEVTKMPITDIVLTCSGALMKNRRQLAYYCVEDGSDLVLTGKLRGGVKKQKLDDPLPNVSELPEQSDNEEEDDFSVKEHDAPCIRRILELEHLDMESMIMSWSRETIKMYEKKLAVVESGRELARTTMAFLPEVAMMEAIRIINI